ncbi:hypothetical protein [Nocardia sp. BMG51109]|uniref:hypothetical protein n=1 Tax=Nocardia sp. BMG51109 TaxID=1056816 RepID=UPI00046410D0|nr:hypothetical protein [Nocardia sp. BMG51109]
MSAGPYDADSGDRYSSRPRDFGGAAHDAFGSAAHDATVRAAHDATVRAAHDATVRAAHDATVRAAHDATVRAAHDATVRAAHDATVRAAHDATVRAGFDAALSVVQAVEASGVSTLDWFEHAATHCRRSGVPRDAVRGAVELGIADGLNDSGDADASLAMLRELLDTTVDRIYRG